MMVYRAEFEFKIGHFRVRHRFDESADGIATKHYINIYRLYVRLLHYDASYFCVECQALWKTETGTAFLKLT